MRGYAPGWQIRCPKCGTIRDAGEMGVIRIKAKSIGKRFVGRCGSCGRLRFLIVERTPDAAERIDASASPDS